MSAPFEIFPDGDISAGFFSASFSLDSGGIRLSESGFGSTVKPVSDSLKSLFDLRICNSFPSR